MAYSSRRSRRQLGFTLVELLVVIAIIGMLVALLLPAVQAVRKRALQTQCLNNIKQLSLGMVSHESAKGQYPGYAQFLKRGNSKYAVMTGTNAEGFVEVNDSPANPANLNNIDPVTWATVLLPRVERQDYWDDLNEVQRVVPIRPIEVFVCPGDTEVMAQKNIAGLSYIVNTGTWDWENDLNSAFILPSGARNGETTANGMFFNNAQYQREKKKAPAHRLSGIKDGAATTLMMSENIHKEYAGSPPFTWFSSSLASPEHRSSEQHLGMVWDYQDDPPQQARIGQADSTTFDPTNQSYARPASSHGGGANVAYCDGHGGYLRDDIDYIVYQQLLTPDGRKCVNPMADPTNPPDTRIKQFQDAPPLAEDDYQ